MINVQFALAVIAVLCGILSHLLYFIHGERHTNALAIVKIYLLLPPVSVSFLYLVLHVDVSLAIKLVVTTIGSYTLSLCASIEVYRILFHPLKGFPGPSLATISKFYHVSRLTGFDNYRVLAAWHDRYGDVVRIGRSAAFISLRTLNGSVSFYMTTSQK